MLRCTHKELIAKCGQRENYPVNFDATYELIPAGPTRTLRISIHHYSKEIWNKTDCKLFRTDNGSGVLILHEVVPSSPNNSPSKMQQTIDKVKSTITNSILDPHHTLPPSDGHAHDFVRYGLPEPRASSHGCHSGARGAGLCPGHRGDFRSGQRHGGPAKRWRQAAQPRRPNAALHAL